MKFPHEYVRSGECVAGCGACCKSISFPLRVSVGDNQIEVDRIYADDPGLRHWVGLHGIQLQAWGVGVMAILPQPWVVRQSSYGDIAFIPQRCSALTGDNRCALHGQAERPLLCEVYPLHPLDLEGLEGVCAYKFKGG